jgi:nonsense-mediated mRNA decay protein 3
MLCTKVSSSIHLIDPVTLKIVEITSAMYWRDPFGAAMVQSQLIEYVVIDVEADAHSQADYNRKTAYSEKVVLAEVTVARASDFGVNDKQMKCLSHLGAILRAGDTVLGYDVKGASLGDAADFSVLKGREFPDVILVRKTYPKKNRASRRNWRLKSLGIEGPEKQLKKSEQEMEEQENERFLQDVEEDAELQKTINVYRKPGEEMKRVAVVDSDDEGELPGIVGLMDEINLADAAELNEREEEEDDTPLDFTDSTMAH